MPTHGAQTQEGPIQHGCGHMIFDTILSKFIWSHLTVETELYHKKGLLSRSVRILCPFYGHIFYVDRNTRAVIIAKEVIFKEEPLHTFNL